MCKLSRIETNFESKPDELAKHACASFKPGPFWLKSESNTQHSKLANDCQTKAGLQPHLTASRPYLSRTTRLEALVCLRKSNH